MLIYLFLISITILIMLLLNIFIGIDKYNYSISYIIGMIVIHIVAVFIIDAIVAFVINKLPKKWFNYKSSVFKIYNWENSFYNHLKIRKWKEHIPELGMLAGFRKNKIKEPNNNDYLSVYLEQSCIGITVHSYSILLGFLIFLIKPKYFFFFALPVSITNGIIHFLSLSILRYNVPKLIRLYERNKKKVLKNE